MSYKEFKDLLKELNLHSYEQDFIDEGFDEVATFNEINEKDVENFKFLKTGHKKKLLLHIKKRQEEEEHMCSESEEIEEKTQEDSQTSEVTKVINLEDPDDEIEEVIMTPTKKRKRNETPTKKKIQKTLISIPELDIGKLLTPTEMIEILSGNQNKNINNQEIYIESLEENLFTEKLKLNCRFIPKNKSTSWVKSIR